MFTIGKKMDQAQTFEPTAAPLDTRVTRLLGIKYPIIQGAMAWIADGKLAAAVSEAGGLGIIACGSAPTEWVREQIELARSLTKNPIGANIMLMNPNTPPNLLNF